jgi:Homeodomain-like domain
MNAAAKAKLELRRWAMEILHAKPVRGAGRAVANREIIHRLETCDIPEELTALIARQLNVDGRVRNESRLKIEPMAAALALAREPGVSNKKLARTLGVSLPTIRRWKNQSGFNNLIAVFAADAVLQKILPHKYKEGPPIGEAIFPPGFVPEKFLLGLRNAEAGEPECKGDK